MDTVGKLREIRDFLNKEVCLKTELKTKSLTSDYKTANPKALVMHIEDFKEKVEGAFLSVVLKNLEDNGVYEIMDIIIAVRVFDDGVSEELESEERKHTGSLQNGRITLLNFMDKIKRALLSLNFVGRIVDGEIKMSLEFEDYFPYFYGSFEFSIKNPAYPRIPLEGEN